MPRYVLATYGVPAYGGTSTACYNFFRRAQRDGHDVHLVCIVERDETAFIDATFGPQGHNPLGLAHVHACRSSAPGGAPPPGLGHLVRELAPDVVVGFGFLPARAMKRAAPEQRVVLVTGACRQAQDYVTSGLAADAMSLARALAIAIAPPELVHATECEAVELADLVVTNSPLTRTMMEHFYPASLGKLWPDVVFFAEWIVDGIAAWRARARAFEARDIDVLFIASDWRRSEKNYTFVETIAQQLAAASVHVVGAVPSALPGVAHHGYIASREDVFDLLGRTKVVVSPSLIDASPGVLFEAAAMGCNVVASKNCGNWELCAPDLLVESFRVEAFVSRIKRALARKYDDGLDEILARRGYDDFLDTLDAFNRPFSSMPLP